MFLAKKWGILIKKESESLVFTGLEIPRDYHVAREALPAFHVTPPCGWMNDPYGFSNYKGTTHLFYQFHPYSQEWGPMHWGHVITKDFVKWTECLTALAPDKEFDEAGCFSGSGIETQKGHLLVYTGVIEKEENGDKNVYQNQCIALGDGLSYEKSAQNPVITGDMLPEKFSREHFRDPKIFKEDDGHYMEKYDKNRHVFDYKNVYSLDDGLDFYTPLDADEIEFFCDGKAVVNIEKHDIVVE